MCTEPQSSHPNELVLASASPRRRELLQRLGLNFSICPADVEELNISDEGPATLVSANARLKADFLSVRNSDALILGSDTTVALGETILNKPSDMEAAYEMLRQLSGREHQVYTAVALVWEQGGLSDCFVEVSEVRFKDLDESAIRAYFKIVDPLDKAGAYGIQVGRDLIIESVRGSVENVMGLPVQALEKHLHQLGFDFRQ